MTLNLNSGYQIPAIGLGKSKQMSMRPFILILSSFV